MKHLSEAVGVRLRGSVGELWARGCKCGLVFDWVFEGWEREWQLTAERYKLDPLIIDARDVRVKLEIGPGRIEAPGTIWTEYEADGKSHRAIIIKGGQLSWQKKRAALALVK